MKKAIIFDNDGVLVDTESMYFQSTREILAEHGVDLTEELFVENLIKTSRGAWHLLGETDLDLDVLRKQRDDRHLELLSQADFTIDGVVDTLDIVKQCHRLCIVSSSKRVHFDRIHRYSEYLDLFEFTVLHEDVTRSKPHPEPYLKALDRLGLAPEECVVVEDSYRGLQSAKAAGVDCVVVHSHFSHYLDLSDATCIIDTIADLPQAVADLTKEWSIANPISRVD